MSYALIIMPSAERELRRFDRPILARLLRRIHTLAENPRPHGTVKLKGVDAYRLRIGEYRVIYSVEDTTRSVYLLSVAHRREAYR